MEYRCCLYLIWGSASLGLLRSLVDSVLVDWFCSLFWYFELQPLLDCTVGCSEVLATVVYCASVRVVKFQSLKFFFNCSEFYPWQLGCFSWIARTHVFALFVGKLKI